MRKERNHGEEPEGRRGCSNRHEVLDPHQTSLVQRGGEVLNARRRFVSPLLVTPAQLLGGQSMIEIPLIDELREIHRRLSEDQGNNPVRFAAMLRGISRKSTATYVTKPLWPEATGSPPESLER